jgi:hypothetical protein
MINVGGSGQPNVSLLGGAQLPQFNARGQLQQHPNATPANVGGSMEPMTAALLTSAVIAGVPYVVEGGANAWDWMTAPEAVDINLDETNQIWANLREQEEAANMEAIRRVRATAGQHVGMNLAMSGASGLSSMNPALAGMARQGELQAAGRISGLERQAVQDRAAYEGSRAEAINRQVAGLGGRKHHKKAVLEGYARASDGPDAERYRAAASSVG